MLLVRPVLTVALAVVAAAADIAPGTLGSTPTELTVLDGQLYFTARTPGAGVELWVFDPATGVAETVSDIVPGGKGSEPREVVAGRPLPVRFYVRNYGPAAITGNVRLELARPDGTMTTRTVRTGMKLGPNGVRLVSFNVTVAAGSPLGDYFAVVSFVGANGPVLAADDLDFAVVPP